MCFPRASTSVAARAHTRTRPPYVLRRACRPAGFRRWTGTTAKFIDVVFGLLETHARRHRYALIASIVLPRRKASRTAGGVSPYGSNRIPCCFSSASSLPSRRDNARRRCSIEPIRAPIKATKTPAMPAMISTGSNSSFMTGISSRASTASVGVSLLPAWRRNQLRGPPPWADAHCPSTSRTFLSLLDPILVGSKSPRNISSRLLPGSCS